MTPAAKAIARAIVYMKPPVYLATSTEFVIWQRWAHILASELSDAEGMNRTELAEFMKLAGMTNG